MAYLLLVLTVLFWAGNFVLGRGIYPAIPPVTLAFWRWTLAVILFLPFSLRSVSRGRKAIWRHWKLLALLALLSVTSFNTFIYIGLRSTPVANAALIQSMIPILIVFASWIGFRERITLRQGVGILLSFLGLLWILARGDPSVLLKMQFSIGDLWALGAAASWAIYSVLLRRRPSTLDAAGTLQVLMIFGTIMLLPLYLWELKATVPMKVSAQTTASILYVAVFPSILSYFFWNKAVSMVGANKAGIFIHLMPVFSILLAFLLLGEGLSLYHLAGMILIFTGIVLTTVDK